MKHVSVVSQLVPGPVRGSAGQRDLPAGTSGRAAPVGGPSPESGFLLLAEGFVAPLRQAGAVDRIAVVGPVASGKTTVAARLGKLLDLPVLDLDDFYDHQAPPAPDVWVARHTELIARTQWIIAGDYRAVAASRFHAADAVIWLDLPRSVCLTRATIRRLRGHPAPLADGWRWVWRYRTRWENGDGRSS